MDATSAKPSSFHDPDSSPKPPPKQAPYKEGTHTPGPSGRKSVHCYRGHGIASTILAALRVFLLHLGLMRTSKRQACESEA